MIVARATLASSLRVTTPMLVDRPLASVRSAVLRLTGVHFPLFFFSSLLFSFFFFLLFFSSSSVDTCSVVRTESGSSDVLIVALYSCHTFMYLACISCLILRKRGNGKRREEKGGEGRGGEGREVPEECCGYERDLLLVASPPPNAKLIKT